MQNEIGAERRKEGRRDKSKHPATNQRKCKQISKPDRRPHQMAQMQTEHTIGMNDAIRIVSRSQNQNNFNCKTVNLLIENMNK